MTSLMMELIAWLPFPQKSMFQVPSNPPADCGHLYCTYSTKTVTVNLNMLATVVIQCTAVETPSITRSLLKWHVSCVFDSANPMMILPRDSRYNLALSLLKSDNCRQSYTASGPHVPMCPTLASGLRTGASRVNITIDYDTSKISGYMFWDSWWRFESIWRL